METLPIVGSTMTSVTKESEYEIKFVQDNGDVWFMHHHQDCCEGEVYADFIRRAKQNLGSKLIKQEDIRHNKSRISTLPEEDRSIINRYIKAEKILNE